MVTIKGIYHKKGCACLSRSGWRPLFYYRFTFICLSSSAFCALERGRSLASLPPSTPLPAWQAEVIDYTLLVYHNLRYLIIVTHTHARRVRARVINILRLIQPNKFITVSRSRS